MVGSLGGESLNTETLLDLILKVVKTEKDEVLKINFLVLLQENIMLFIEESKTWGWIAG